MGGCTVMGITNQSAKAIWCRVKGHYIKYPSVRFITTLLFVTVLYFAMCLCFGCYYMTSDDPIMMRNLSGYYTGIPSSYDLFVSTPLGLLSKLFYTMFPNVSWYSVFHVSSTVLCVSVVLFELLEQIPFKIVRIRTMCTLLIIFLVGAVMAFPFHIFNFSVTAALYGSASLIVLLSLVNTDLDRRFFRKYSIATAFLLLSELVRSSAFKAVLPFYILIILYIFIRRGKNWKKNVKILLAITTVVLISLIFSISKIDQYYKDTMVESETYVKMRSLRAAYMDSVNLPYEENKELYESLGWDEDFYKISKSQMFLDRRFNVENLTKIVDTNKDEANQTTYFSRIKNAVNHFFNITPSGTITFEAIDMPTFTNIKKLIVLLFLLVCIICSASAAYWKNKGNQTLFVELLLIAGINAIAVGEIAYLCYLGRFILRALLCSVLPALCVNLYFLAKVLYRVTNQLNRYYFPFELVQKNAEDKCIKRFELKVGTIFMVLGLAMSFVLMQLIFVRTFDSTFRNIKDEKINNSQIIEDYCMSNPDNFYLHDGVAFNKLIFINMKELRGCGKSLLFWGGQEVFTKSYYDAIHAFGYSEFYTDNLLDENVYFITLNSNLSDSVFMSYMRSAYGDDIQCKIADILNDHIYVYQFFRLQVDKKAIPDKFLAPDACFLSSDPHLNNSMFAAYVRAAYGNDYNWNLVEKLSSGLFVYTLTNIRQDEIDRMVADHTYLLSDDLYEKDSEILENIQEAYDEEFQCELTESLDDKVYVYKLR